MSLQNLLTDAENVLSKLIAATTANSGSVLTEIESVVSLADPADAGIVQLVGGLVSVGERLYAQFKQIAAQTKETAPAVWNGIVAANLGSDAAVEQSFADHPAPSGGGATPA